MGGRVGARINVLEGVARGAGGGSGGVGGGSGNAHVARSGPIVARVLQRTVVGLQLAKVDYIDCILQADE